MGYTNHWKFRTHGKNTVNLDEETFKKFSKTCEKAVKRLGIPLAGGDGTGEPEFTDNYIWFNGVGEKSCETMYMERVVKQQEWRRGEEWTYDFCKTERYPYDAAVALCLLIAKHFFKDDFQFRSDGESDGMKKAFEVFKQLNLK